MTFHNFGDISIEHGQIWISDERNDDYAACVQILHGSDISLSDNQYWIETGSIYFSPDNWNAALENDGRNVYGPPEFLDIAAAYFYYIGMDRDHWGPEIVQVGKAPDFWSIYDGQSDPETVLHGNASIEKYVANKYLT